MNAKDIAKLAGVSRSTVTRVVNNYPDISEKTREKVMKVIKEYQYEPDTSARTLSGKLPQEIGLFLATDKSKKISSSQYYMELITNIIDKAEENGYSVLVSTVSPNDYSNVSRLMNMKRIQGAIIFGGIEDLDVLNQLKKDYKIIFIEQFHEDSEICNYYGLTNIDNYKGAYIATEYLINKGFNNIVHMTGNVISLSSKERLRGYRDALINHNLNYNEDTVLVADYTSEFSEEVMNEYLDRCSPPEAIFAVTDATAIGVINSLRKHGFSVPKDVSIVGFDNLYVSTLFEPKLTTIFANVEKVAHASVEEIIYAIENKTKPRIQKIDDMKLIERNSVAKK